MSMEILKNISVITMMLFLAMNASAAIITVDDDGPADYKSIQAAINAAKEGDVIQVAAGTYIEHVEVRKNIHLLGEGSDVTRIEFAGDKPTVLVTDVKEASIEAFTIAYAGPELDDNVRVSLRVQSSAVKISENLITGNGQGIRCTDSSSVEITKNRINGNRRGIFLSYSNGQISNNTIQNNGKNGIFASDVHITQLGDNHIAGNEEDGIYLDATTVEKFLNNIVKENGDDGIHLIKTEVNILDNNTIQDNEDSGLVAEYGTQITQLSQNQILGHEARGIYFDTTTVGKIINNTIKNNVGLGIMTFDAQITQIENNQILNNSIRGLHLVTSTIEKIVNNNIQGNQSIGIFASDTKIAQLEGNQIIGNGHGIQLEESTIVNTLVSNTIQDNGESGIQLQATIVNTLINNTIKGNQGGIVTFLDTQITQLSQNQILGNLDGIYLDSTTVEQLSNNTIKENKKTGLVTEPGTQIAKLEDNQIRENGVDGLFLAKTKIESFVNNIIQKNGDDGIYLGATTVGTMINNIIKDNQKCGILGSGAHIAQLEDNQIVGNKGKGIYLGTTTVGTMVKNTIQDNGEYGIETFSDTQINQLKSNQIISNNGRGIYLESAIVEELVNNTIQDNEHSGIFASGTQITQLSQNQIHGNKASGIYLKSVIVEELVNNTIRDNEHSGIFAFGTQISQLSQNRIRSNNNRGVALTETPVKIFVKNIIYDNEGDGIFLVSTAVEELLNNTIVNNNGAGILTDGTSQINAKNNIIAQNVWGIVFSEDARGTLSPNLAYNDIWNNTQGNYGSGIRPGITDIHVNPMFVDPGNGDYHLQATSPLIGAGENGVDIGAISAVILKLEISGSPAKAGDTITVRITASPNALVSFDLEGIQSDIAMPPTEVDIHQGAYTVSIYEGKYTVSANDRGIDVPVILRVKTKSGYLQIDTSQNVTLSGGIQAVEVAGSPAKAGGEIQVSLQADAGGSAEFSIDRIAEAVPMLEVADGVYQGSYQVQNGDNADDAILTVVWTDKDGWAALDSSQTVRIDTITVLTAGSPAKAGDVLTITAAGKSGNTVTFKIDGVTFQEIPMNENPEQPGIYTGEYPVKEGDNVRNGVVMVTVRMASGDAFVNETATVTVDTLPPEIRDAVVSGLNPDITVPIVQNGDTFEITLISEPGASVTVDVSALDTTKSILALSETFRSSAKRIETKQPGHYSRLIQISPENEALNGAKTLPVLAVDVAGNQADSQISIELSNPEKPTEIPPPPTAFIRVHPDVLPADGTSTALVTASLNESITDLSAISLQATAGHLSDLQLVEPNYLTATYTSGLSVGEVTMILTILESGNSMSARLILIPPDAKTDFSHSKISWDYLPQHAKIFQSIRISGKLTPHVGGEVVLLTVTSPDTLANEIVELHTDFSGRWAYPLVPDTEGIWSFQVYWPGNEVYQATLSELRQVIIVKGIPPSPLTKSGWSRLTTADGLTNNEVTALAEDSKGRIWIGTKNGLSVFDGQISQTFTAGDSRITTLQTDRYGRIWIGSVPDENSHGSGLTLYDEFGRFQQFTEEGIFLSYVLAIHEDLAGNLWLGGDGLTLYDGVKLQSIEIPGADKEFVVSAFTEDMRGRIWIVTDVGLFLYSSGNWTHFTKERDSLPSNHIQSLLMDSEGVLWIGTFEGLARYDGRKFKVFNEENSELPSNFVTSLMEDSDGQILIGMLNGGVVRFDEWRTLSVELENQSVNALLQDSQCQLWVGTEMGLLRFDRKTFNSWRIAEGKGTFFQDSEGNLWMGSEVGLTRFDGLQWNPVLEFWNIPIHCIAQDGDGRIWVGHERGLAIFDGKTWTRLREIHGLFLGAVKALLYSSQGANTDASLLDTQGKMFLGTRGGLFMLLDGESWRNLTSELNSERKTITDFTMDSSGVLWIGTTEGLFRYDGTEASPVELEAWELSEEGISDLAVDSKENLWVATQRGLSRCDRTTWQTYTVQNSGIASDNVTSLAIDGLGRIWIGTDSGISRFDGLAFSYLSPSEAWVTFTSQNSILVDDDIQSLFVDGHGQIWINTPESVIRFTPNSRSPDTKIVRAPRSTVGTDTPFFEYTGADVESKKEELLYSYKVDNGEWSPYSKNTFVTLPTQSNGVHTFFVRAMDKDGNVDATPAQRSFRIDITPPTVTITQPSARQVIGAQFEIQGYAIDYTDFESYTLVVKNEANQEEFRHESEKNVENDTLALWNTTTVQDGIYTILLTSTDKIDGPDDEAHKSQTDVSVIVDNTLPIAHITSPTDNQTLSGMIPITGEISDKHIDSCRLEYSKDETNWIQIETEEISESPAPIAFGWGSRGFLPQAGLTAGKGDIQTDWNSASVGGKIILRLVAIDKAGNENDDNISLNLTNKNPDLIAMISKPSDGEIISEVIEISVSPTSGVELIEYTLTLVHPPITLRHQTENFTEPSSLKTTWDTTRLDDGEYTLQLIVVDSNELTSTHKVSVKIDNTPPTAEITFPRKNDQVGGNVSIKGTAMDTNVKEYVIEFGEGTSPQSWTKTTKKEPVEAGTLMEWTPEKRENHTGIFVLRLTVYDLVGHQSETSVTVRVLPPLSQMDGGDAESDDRKASISIPPRGLTQDIAVITINPVREDEIQIPRSPTIRPIGIAYDFEPKSLILKHIKPATITIVYPENIEPFSPSKRLALFWWNEKIKDWHFVGGTADLKTNRIQAAVEQLGRYAVMETDAKPHLPIAFSDVPFTCQPRVFSPNGGGVSQMTTISFTLNQPSSVNIKVYNIDGRLQRRLIVEQHLEAGRQAFPWDGKDDAEQIVPSGLYLITVATEQETMTKTVVVQNR